MLIPIKSRSSLKLGHFGSETRSLGQILGKPCVHSRGHSFEPKFMRLCQNVISVKSMSSSILDHVRSKTRLLGQIIEKPCVHSRGHSLGPKFMKLCQNVNHNNI